MIVRVGLWPLDDPHSTALYFYVYRAKAYDIMKILLSLAVVEWNRLPFSRHMLPTLNKFIVVPLVTFIVTHQTSQSHFFLQLTSHCFT